MNARKHPKSRGFPEKFTRVNFTGPRKELASSQYRKGECLADEGCRYKFHKAKQSPSHFCLSLRATRGILPRTSACHCEQRVAVSLPLLLVTASTCPRFLTRDARQSPSHFCLSLRATHGSLPLQITSFSIPRRRRLLRLKGMVPRPQGEGNLSDQISNPKTAQSRYKLVILHPQGERSRQI